MFEQGNVKEALWEDLRENVQQANPELFDVLDSWRPSYKLYKISYGFGMKILKDGVFYLPIQAGYPLPMTHQQVPSQLKDEFSYSSVPLGLVLNKSSEVFIEFTDNVIPIVMLRPGSLMGLLETLEPQTRSFCARELVNATAGVRSSYMLPKISDKLSHARLIKKYKLKTQSPRRLIDQNKVFVDLANSPFFNSDWKMELLVFSKKWFEEDPNNIHWLRFNHYLNKRSLMASGFGRNKEKIDIMWQLFAKALGERCIKPNSQVFDIVKHLIFMAMGAVPGFAAIDKNDDFGPFNEIRKIYIDDYRLNYAPTLVVPSHFDVTAQNSKPVYYFMQLATELESLPRSRKPDSMLAVMRAVKNFLFHFFDIASEGKLKIENTLMEEVANKANFDFFHADAQNENGISSSKEMPEKDLLLNDDGKFTDACTLTRGCIRVYKSA